MSAAREGAELFVQLGLGGVTPVRRGTDAPLHPPLNILYTSKVSQIRSWAYDFPGCNWRADLEPAGYSALRLDLAANPDGVVQLSHLADLHDAALPTGLILHTPAAVFIVGRGVLPVGQIVPGVKVQHRILVPGSEIAGGTVTILAGDPATVPDWPEWLQDISGAINSKDDHDGRII